MVTSAKCRSLASDSVLSPRRASACVRRLQLCVMEMQSDDKRLIVASLIL